MDASEIQSAEPFVVGSGQVVTQEWYSIPIAELPQMVADYIATVEKAKTNEICKCEWLVHPDDAHLPEGTGRRMRRGDVNLECPVHTKEGYLLGFFDWLRTQM